MIYPWNQIQHVEKYKLNNTPVYSFLICFINYFLISILKCFINFLDQYKLIVLSQIKSFRRWNTKNDIRTIILDKLLPLNVCTKRLFIAMDTYTDQSCVRLVFYQIVWYETPVFRQLVVSDKIAYSKSAKQLYETECLLHNEEKRFAWITIDVNPLPLNSQFDLQLKLLQQGLFETFLEN